MNYFSDKKLNFNKDLGLYTIYIDKKNNLFIANQSYDIQCYLLINTNELIYSLKGHTNIIYQMDQINENNLISCGYYEIIIWNLKNGEKMNVFNCGGTFGSFC